MASPIRIIISDDALRALREIFRYIQTDSPRNAATVTERLLDAIDSLDFMPARYGVVGESRSRGTAIHRMVVRPYLVYYSISETASTVTILTILHGARLQPEEFD